VISACISIRGNSAIAVPLVMEGMDELAGAFGSGRPGPYSRSQEASRENAISLHDVRYLELTFEKRCPESWEVSWVSLST